MSSVQHVVVATTEAGAEVQVLFHAIQPPGVPVPMANVGPVHKVAKSMEDVAAAMVLPVASVVRRFEALLESVSEVEITIGLTLTAEGQIFVAKSSAEGAFEVTVKLRNSEASRT